MAHDVDIHVGKMIRACRSVKGITQHGLAGCVGIKFQQIQKYETGANRVSASRLWDISQALGVSVASFFEGLHPDVNAAHEAQKDAEPQGEVSDDIMRDEEAMELVRSFYSIPENQRRHLFELARVLGDAA